MVTISIINQKGGVAKTTSTVHLGAYLSKKGYKVLLLDSDPQTDLSKSLNYFESDDNIADLFAGKNISPKQIDKNLFLIPGYEDLEEIELNEKQMIKGISSFFEKFDEEFDICLIDCQPRKIIRDRLSINKVVLIASNFLLIPLDANSNTITGTQNFMKAVEHVKEINSNLNILGIFFSRVNQNELVYKIFREHLENIAPDLILKSFIRKDTKLVQATVEGKTIFQYSPKSNSALDFKKLGNEIINKLKKLANEK